MHTTAVAMFCGPRDEGDRIPVRRIDKAIGIALAYKFPLFVAGDAADGAEVVFYWRRAKIAGVQRVIPAFDGRRCTLSDAQAVARKVRDLQLDELERVHLVTDWWHMERSNAMLECELARSTGREIEVIPHSVRTGPWPTRLVRANEHQGLQDYLDGVYGQRQGIIDPLRRDPRPDPFC